MVLATVYVYLKDRKTNAGEWQAQSFGVLQGCRHSRRVYNSGTCQQRECYGSSTRRTSTRRL